MKLLNNDDNCIDKLGEPPEKANNFQSNSSCRFNLNSFNFFLFKVCKYSIEKIIFAISS